MTLFELICGFLLAFSLTILLKALLLLRANSKNYTLAITNHPEPTYDWFRELSHKQFKEPLPYIEPAPLRCQLYPRQIEANTHEGLCVKSVRVNGNLVEAFAVDLDANTVTVYNGDTPELKVLTGEISIEWNERELALWRECMQKASTTDN